MSGEAITSFTCFACKRRFKWREEIAGRTLRCKCGEKIKCPETADATMTGRPSLDDTLAQPIGPSLDQTAAPTATNTGLEDTGLDNPTVGGDESANLDDTVADVELGEHLDDIEETAPESTESAGEIAYRRVTNRGVFGKSMGFEVAFFSVFSLIGVCCAIMAMLLWEHYLPWVVAALLIGPYSWLRLYRAWPLWTQGRTWMECLEDVLTGGDRENE